MQSNDTNDLRLYSLLITVLTYLQVIWPMEPESYKTEQILFLWDLYLLKTNISRLLRV